MPSRRIPDPVAVKVGARIRQLRLEKKLSLARLATASGLSKGHVSNLENGLALMNIRTIAAAAGALGVPSYLLLMFPGEEPMATLVEDVRIASEGDLGGAADVLRERAFGGKRRKRWPKVPPKGGGK